MMNISLIDMLMYLDQHLKRIELEFEHMMDSEKT